MPLKLNMPGDIPKDLMAAAEDSEMAVEDDLLAVVPAPEKPFSAKVVNALSKALAEAGKVMGLEAIPETYTGMVEALEPDTIRFLAMFEQAASDYGSPFPVPLSELSTEESLTAVTAHLLQLARDPDFAEWLDQPADGEEVVEEEVTEETGGSKGSAEFDFMARI